jgi:hypothetical protein
MTAATGIRERPPVRAAGRSGDRFGRAWQVPRGHRAGVEARRRGAGSAGARRPLGAVGVLSRASRRALGGVGVGSDGRGARAYRWRFLPAGSRRVPVEDRERHDPRLFEQLRRASGWRPQPRTPWIRVVRQRRGPVDVGRAATAARPGVVVGREIATLSAVKRRIHRGPAAHVRPDRRRVLPVAPAPGLTATMPARPGTSRPPRVEASALMPTLAAAGAHRLRSRPDELADRFLGQRWVQPRRRT